MAKAAIKTKEQLIKRWEVVLKSTKERIPRLTHRLSSGEYDRSVRYYADGLKNEYALLAKLEYLLNHDINSFKLNLEKAAECQIELFEIFESRPPNAPPNPGLDPMDLSSFSMFLFCKLLDSLASGNIGIAIYLASYMGGRSAIEDKYDDEFTLSMGYSLKYAVEGNKTQLQAWLPRLKAVCEDPEYTVKDFIGYYLMLKALLENNLEEANSAFKVLILNHKKRCKKAIEKHYPFRSYFYDSPDEDVFVWGIGLANLCRYYGLKVTINDPIIPEELIIPATDH